MDAISYLLHVLQSHKQIYKFDNQSTESVYNTYTIHIKQHIVLQNDQNKHCLLSTTSKIVKCCTIKYFNCEVISFQFFKLLIGFLLAYFHQLSPLTYIIMFLRSTIIKILWFMVFNTTFNNISAISWWSVLLVLETGEPGENHRLVASH